MGADHQISTIHATGKIEQHKTDIEFLCRQLQDAPLWRPGAVLLKQCKDGIRMIRDLEKRFHQKLVVTIVGPSGAGKSTLLNALAGVDDLSAVGHERPTTRKIIAFSKSKADLEQLIDRLGETSVAARWRPGAAQLSHVILLDTPDTDSTDCETHAPMIQSAIALSDLLICVFDAENPKRRDHADFLAPYIGFFEGSGLVVAVNKCDRQDEDELRRTIMPDFSTYLQTAWGRSADEILCTSARRHLKAPGWDEAAGPRHDFDQFPMLRDLVFGTMDQAGFAVDQRVAHAGRLSGYLTEMVQKEAKKDAASLADALDRIRQEEKEAVGKVLHSLKESETNPFLGINVLLYQKLSQRWIGPMGWLVALWARLLVFGAGAAAVFRVGHPIRQVWGMFSSFRQAKETHKAMDAVQQGDHMASFTKDYRISFMRAWPDISKRLMLARFDTSVQKVDKMLPEVERLAETLLNYWQDALSDTIDRFAQRLSHGVVQFFLNMPPLAILAYTAWITLREFYHHNYLSSDFFLHAFLNIGILLFFCFFLYQAIVRFAASGDRLISSAFKRVSTYCDTDCPKVINPLEEQIDVVLGLAEINKI